MVGSSSLLRNDVMCHTVSHDARDAPPALGRPGRGPAAAGHRPRTRRRLRRHPGHPGLLRRHPPCVRPERRPARLAAGGRRRRRGARRRRHPTPAHPRQVHAGPAPRPRGRPVRRARRGRPTGLPRRTSRPCSPGPSSTTWPSCPSAAARASRAGWSPAATGSPAWSASTWCGSTASSPSTSLPHRRPPAGHARSGRRGRPRRARTDARPLPAVLRVRLDRWLRRHPLQRPVVRRLRPLRRHGRRTAGGHPDRRARASAPPRPTRPDPTCARPSWARRGRSASSPRSPSGCDRLLRRRRTRRGPSRRSPRAPTRCAGSARPACCRRSSASPTRPRRWSTSRARRTSAARASPAA